MLKPVKIRFHLYGFPKKELMQWVDQYQKVNDLVADYGNQISALYPDISVEEWVDKVLAYIDYIHDTDLFYLLVQSGDSYILMATDSTGSRRIWTEIIED